MSEQRPGHALIDLVAVLISPILVMMMVGSLVFFLIEVLYGGKYTDRLIYTFFFFVIGAVLIARISIQMGSGRARIYAALLGLACFLAMLRFVEYPNQLLEVLGPILNIVLMGIVWWSASKLTWDCTHFDEARKASGRGVLSAAGMEPSTEPDEVDEQPGPKKKKKEPGGLVGWWERWQNYREAQNKKPHTPGTWVLYFGLAAIPLFALGQSLIPADDAARRRTTFIEMVIYVGSALALLVSTTLFGLKKYLEERNAKIPATLTLGWLGLGGGLIVVFIVAASILPRPHSETPIVSWNKGGKLNRQASKYAQVKDKSAGEGQGAEGKKTEAGDGKSNAKGGKQGGNKGDKQSGGGKGDQQGGKKSDGQQGKNKSDDEKNNKSSNGPNKADEDKNGSKSDEQKDGKEQTDGGEAEQTNKDEKDSNDGNDSGSSSPSKLFEALEKFSDFVKWIVWIVIAVAVIAGIIWFLLKGLAPFTKWARDLLDWLKSLFGRREEQEELAEEAKREEQLQRPPPFRVFSNPFADGSAERKSPSELVEYTFSAMDSWAWDQGEGRQPDETPMEFAIRLGHTFPDLDEPGFDLADLYVRVLYSSRDVTRKQANSLEKFWDVLDEIPMKKSPQTARQG